MQYLIVGLGNPGRVHAGQRHNVGFMAVDQIADHWKAESWKNKFSGEITQATIQGVQVLLQKPHTFMNLSGDAVAQAARFYKIPPQNIIALHDELDIPFAQIRVKQGGGAGGHNGLRSMDACLGTANYWRVRIGIDHPGEKYLVTPHVLGNFTGDERTELDNVLSKLAKDIGLLVTGKQQDLMRRLKPPAPPKVKPAKPDTGTAETESTEIKNGI